VKLASIEAIVGTLNQTGVRYLVAGGVAVNAHGYLRFTQDMDLVIALDPANIVRAFDALSKLGYKPQVPITAEQFANADFVIHHQNLFACHYASSISGRPI